MGCGMRKAVLELGTNLRKLCHRRSITKCVARRVGARHRRRQLNTIKRI